MNFKNKKILITGATGGIGNSLVNKFSDLGAEIVATGTNEEKVSHLKKKFPDIYTEKFKLDDHTKIEEFILHSYYKQNISSFEKTLISTGDSTNIL